MLCRTDIFRGSTYIDRGFVVHGRNKSVHSTSCGIWVFSLEFYTRMETFVCFMRPRTTFTVTIPRPKCLDPILKYRSRVEGFKNVWFLYFRCKVHSLWVVDALWHPTVIHPPEAMRIIRVMSPRPSCPCDLLSLQSWTFVRWGIYIKGLVNPSLIFPTDEPRRK